MRRSIALTVPCTENCGDDSYDAKLAPHEYDAAIDAAESHLGAVHFGHCWYYRAYETGEVYRLTKREIAALGAGLLDGRGVDYSLWCGMTGALVKRPGRKIAKALHID